jgi:MATE family multidrug resistance protein
MADRQISTLKRLLGIALPMVISQASDTVMLFADRLMVSRLGELHLAAAMSGGLTQFTVSSFFIGMVGYVNAVVAQYYGAGRRERCAPAAYQAFLLSLLSYPLLLALSPLVRYLFVFAGHGAEQIGLEYLYFKTLNYGAVLFVLRAAFTGFFLGIGRTRTVMIANLVGMVVNLPANYVFIYGKFGMPAFGIEGAGFGTIIGAFATLVILAAAYWKPKYRAMYGTHKFSGIDFDLLRRLLRFGAPAGVEMVLNVAAFNIFVQFMHSYGTDVAAAVTVTFNWDIVAFIPMLGMGAAVTSVVGQNVGARNYREARRTAYVALGAAWAYSGVMMLLFFFGARMLVGVFLDTAPGGSAAAPLAVDMLRLAALYTLADSCQLVFSGALRGAGDTKTVMRISVGLHWVFAVLSFVLIRVAGWPPMPIWIVFILFVVILGAAMYLRFRFGGWKDIELIDTDGSIPPPQETTATEVAGFR